jgi:hypothetical protein
MEAVSVEPISDPQVTKSVKKKTKKTQKETSDSGYPLEV